MDEYPLQTSSGHIELLDAVTIYNFKDRNDKDGRWLAVLKVKSTFERSGKPQSAISVRIYGWRWRRGSRYNRDAQKYEPYGEYRWYRDHSHNINKRSIWERTRDAIEGFIGDL